MTENPTAMRDPLDATGPHRLHRIPRSVWALGFVSMFMDVSSEMVHALLPVYLVTVLGASTVAVGFIEGVAEATANFTKVFSGALSDWLQRRKLLAAIGYALSAFTKPIYPLANTLSWVVAARFLDRVGKGIRGAPRDALVADLAPAHLRGASFGLRQALDSIGAFVGPLAAIGLMAAFSGQFRTVFWFAVIPAMIAVALMIFGVDDPATHSASKKNPPPRISDARRMGPAFWVVVAIGAVLTLARFSEAFLVLRALNVGLSATLVPLVLVVMNVVYAGAAYPAGVLTDRLGRRPVFMSGIILLLVADVILAFGATIPLTLVGVLFWGLHMAFTQGLFATLIADTAPESLRGSAFGVFNLVMGLAMLLASVIAGALWNAYGPMMTFLGGTVFTLLAFAGLLFFGRDLQRREVSGPS